MQRFRFASPLLQQGNVVGVRFHSGLVKIEAMSQCRPCPGQPQFAISEGGLRFCLRRAARYRKEENAMSRIVSAFIRAHTTPEPDVPPPEPEKDPPPDNTPLPETPPIEEPVPKQPPMKAG
jgi:hypothetical protein